MTQRRNVLVVAAVAGVAVLLVVASILTNSKSAPSGGRSNVAAVEASTNATPSNDATASTPSGESTTARPPSATPQPPSAKKSASGLAPVREKKPLAAIEGAPPRTLAFVKMGAADRGDSYTITFSPYGYGPGGKGRSLLVRVDRSTPVGKPKRIYPFEGRNVLLDVSELRETRAIEFGGSFTGTIEFVSKGDTLVPRLQSVRR